MRSRKPEEDFIVRHTRKTPIGVGRFELAYFRHAGKWFTVYRGLTAAECFKEIEGERAVLADDVICCAALGRSCPRTIGVCGNVGRGSEGRAFYLASGSFCRVETEVRHNG